MHSEIDRAIGFAARAHDGQHRKTGNVPYIAHPFAVAMILQEMGCEETVIVAGLLHDTVEDTKVTLDEIRASFGDDVANIVAVCTEPSKKRFNWESRKLHMIEALRDAPLSAKLVAASDKYHNLGHTLYTKQTLGSKIWNRFGKDEAHQAWYYRSMLKSITANVSEPERYPIFGRLEILINEIFDGIPSQSPKPR